MKVRDAALACAVMLAGLLLTAPMARWQVERAVPGALGYALIVAAALPLAVRRRWPIAALAVTTLAAASYLLLGYAFGPILLNVLIAVYTVAVCLPLAPATLAGAGALALLLAHLFVDPGSWLDGIGPGSAWIVVPFAVGVVVRYDRASAVRDKARAADEERLRVAQEVHDAVGHGLAAIRMQAEIALHVLPQRPEQAAAALTAISSTSKDALDELRATLAVVRRDGAAPATPGLRQLDRLASRVADAGVPVSIAIEGESRVLPNAVDLTAYRIVQESLTNVLRHAGPASARVRLVFGDDRLTIEVRDDGRGGIDMGTGQGIAGMRDRTQALGGTVQAGPVQSGPGWRVVASIPAGTP